MPLPTFLVIGAAKAGTTALHAWLAQRPDICMSRPKETQFFSLDFDKGPAFYEQYFRHHAGETIIGESTPIYLSLPHVPRRIARLLPDVHLVAVLRNPVDQAYSAWWMMRSLGAERRGFAEAIATEVQQPLVDETTSEPTWRAILDAARRGRPAPSSHYLLIGRYTEALARYRQLFGRQRMTVLLHEDLRSRPEEATAEVAAAIGARADVPWRQPPMLNAAPGPLEASLQRQLRRLPVPGRVRRPLLRGIRRIDRRGPPPMDERTRALLQRYFTEANAGLADVAGRDVSAWFTP